jgi:hypothetical protein
MDRPPGPAPPIAQSDFSRPLPADAPTNETRQRTTLTIDEDVLKWVKIRAARTGKPDSAVIEESLRRDLKLDVRAARRA